MSTNSSHLRRAGALLLILGLITGLLAVFGPAAAAEGDTPVVTLEDGVNGCNGVRPTPGSENTSKRLDPSFPSEPGRHRRLTERDNPLFSSVVVPGNGTVVIDGDGETVAFTNTRLTGSLTVNKTTVGGSGTFTFDVDCSDNRSDQTFTITDSGSKTITGIPTTTTCTVTERSNPLFSSTLRPAGGNVTISVRGQTVAFTNARITGSLTVDKTTTGGSGTFVFDVNCDGTVHDTTLTITGSGSATASGIPTTTSCTVTERADPLFSSVVVPGNGTVVVDADGESVTFTNTARPSGIALDKKVNGADHATAGDALEAHVGDTLRYTVVITNTGEIPLTPVSLTDSLFAGMAATCSRPVGSTVAPGGTVTCTYDQTAGTDVSTWPR